MRGSGLFGGLPIREIFKYHPVMTDERRHKHQEVDRICVECATGLDGLVGNGMLKDLALVMIMLARMLINQMITYEELENHPEQRHYSDEEGLRKTAQWYLDRGWVSPQKKLVSS